MKNVEERFKELEAEWWDGTMFLSNPNKILAHPAYRKIVGLGEPALPIILRSLKSQESGAFLFYALADISGEWVDIPEEHRGKIDKIIDLWLEWGKAKGLI